MLERICNPSLSFPYGKKEKLKLQKCLVIYMIFFIFAL